MIKSLRDKIKQKIVLGYKKLFSGDKLDPALLKSEASGILDEILRHEKIDISQEDKDKVIGEILDELIGFGPLEKLMNDPAITEIMVNGPSKVYIERNGSTEFSGVQFENENQIMYLIEKMLAPTRRHVDESYPFTEISLKDGSRINIIIPPLALDGPTLTIRKFSKDIRKAEDLIALGSLDKRMSEFLIACIKAKINIVFAGSTGAGKTTTLNVLSSYINNDERIITIEDTAELRLTQEHVVRLEARQQSIEGKGEVSIRDLFKNSLRMRPDRIVLGEIRGAEALDMLQAICSGHRGSLAVIHANSPQDLIYRLETMILMSGIPISLEAIHRQIAAAINLIVEQEQLVDGSRKITSIAQINGLKDNQVVLEDLFLFEQEGIDENGKVIGTWHATGIKPVFLNIFKKLNIKLSEDLFKKD